jgi:hypothetical protein
MKSQTKAHSEAYCEICETIVRLKLPAAVHTMFTCAKKDEGSEHTMLVALALAA